MNSFGDEQLAVDMVADKLLFEACRYSVSASPHHLSALLIDTALSRAFTNGCCHSLLLVCSTW